MVSSDLTLRHPYLRTVAGAGVVRNIFLIFRNNFHSIFLSLDGMFAILVPATLLPLIITLFWAEQKAKRLGIVDATLANSNGAPRTSGMASRLDP